MKQTFFPSFRRRKLCFSKTTILCMHFYKLLVRNKLFFQQNLISNSFLPILLASQYINWLLPNVSKMDDTCQLSERMNDCDVYMMSGDILMTNAQVFWCTWHILLQRHEFSHNPHTTYFYTLLNYSLSLKPESQHIGTMVVNRIWNIMRYILVEFEFTQVLHSSNQAFLIETYLWFPNTL